MKSFPCEVLVLPGCLTVKDKMVFSNFATVLCFGFKGNSIPKEQGYLFGGDDSA